MLPASASPEPLAARGARRVRPGGLGRERQRAPAAAAAPSRIELENRLPGTSAWQIRRPAMEREIEGYADQTSVPKGWGDPALRQHGEPRLFAPGLPHGLVRGSRRSRRHACGCTSRIAHETLQPQPACSAPTNDPATSVVECAWRNPIELRVQRGLDHRRVSREAHGRRKGTGSRSRELHHVRRARRREPRHVSLPTPRHDVPGLQQLGRAVDLPAQHGVQDRVYGSRRLPVHGPERGGVVDRLLRSPVRRLRRGPLRAQRPARLPDESLERQAHQPRQRDRRGAPVRFRPQPDPLARARRLRPQLRDEPRHRRRRRRPARPPRDPLGRARRVLVDGDAVQRDRGPRRRQQRRIPRREHRVQARRLRAERRRAAPAPHARAAAATRDPAGRRAIRPAGATYNRAALVGLFSAYFPGRGADRRPQHDVVDRAVGLSRGRFAGRRCAPGPPRLRGRVPGAVSRRRSAASRLHAARALVADVLRQGAGLLAAGHAKLRGHDGVSRCERRAGDRARVALLAVGARCLQRQSARTRDRRARGGGEPVGVLVRQGRPAQPPRRPDHDERARAARGASAVTLPRRQPRFPRRARREGRRAPAGPAARRRSTRHVTRRRHPSVA